MHPQAPCAAYRGQKEDKIGADMKYIISAEKIVQKSCRMILDESALPGVKRIAGIVAHDMELVFGTAPAIRYIDYFFFL